HLGFRICPISGPGTLNKSERRLCAEEILVEKGINSRKNLAAAIEPAKPVTFQEQAETMLAEMRQRRREPVAESTIESYERALRLHLNPILGDYPLGEIYNPE